MRTNRSMRQSTTPGIRQRMSWKYAAAAGIAMVVVVGIGVFIWLNLGNSRDSAAAVKTIIYSKQNGNWGDAASWEPRGPQSGDSVVLKSGHKIDMMKSYTYEGIKISVYGTLWIDQAAKLNLTKDSKIEVFGPDGTIDGGKEGGLASNSTSTRIEYEGTSIWDSSMGAVSGYSSLDQNGYNAVGTLPVTLAYFTAKPEGGKVKVEWATEAEENNDFFTVERSTDGKLFRTIGNVRGAGNSKSKLTYSYTDNLPVAGKAYYRLKQTDYDGKFEYFKPEMVENTAVQHIKESALTIHKVGPNPFQEAFFVDYELSADGPVEIRLMNMSGQVVVTELVEGYAGSNRFNFNDDKGLLKGTYILSLAQNNTAAKPVRIIKN